MVTKLKTLKSYRAQDGEDVLAATPTVRVALEHVARAVVAAPAARWWTTALDTTAQCRVLWVEDGRPPRPPDPDPGAALAAWRVEAVTEEEIAAGRSVAHLGTNQLGCARACQGIRVG